NPALTTVSGSVPYTQGDGPDIAKVTVNGATVTGIDSVIHGAHGDLTVSISNGEIHYTYVLTTPVTETPAANNGADTQVADTFKLTLTDVDGSSASGTLTINAVDDVPTASVTEARFPDLALDESYLPTGSAHGDEGGATSVTGHFAPLFDV